MEEGAVPRQQDRRRRRRDRSQESERHVRGDVGGVSRRVSDVERRTGQRAVQVDRRRRDVARNHAQSGAAVGARRQDQHRHLRRRLQSRLRARRERKRRPLQLRRRGRDVEARERRADDPAARVLLHARVRRPEQQGHGVCAQHERVPIDRRRQDARADRTGHARRSPRHVDRSRRRQSRDAGQRRRRHDQLRRRSAAAPLDQSGLRDRPVLSRHHDQARSLSRVRRAAGQHDDVRRQHHESRRTGRRRRRWTRQSCGAIRRRRRRARLHRARSERSGRLLRRRQQRIVSDAPRSPQRRAEGSRRLSALLLRREFLLRRRAMAMDVPDHLFSRRPERPLHLLAARVEDDQRRTNVGADQRRSHPPRSEDDAGLGRADHARHEQPGDLRDGVLARTRQDGRQRDLGRIRRRRRAGDPRRRQEVDGRDAARHARSRPRQPDRRIGVRRRDRVRVGEEAAARGFLALHRPHARLRPHVDEDRQRHRGERLRVVGP